MSMRHYACSAIFIVHERIQELVPKEYTSFMSALRLYGISLEEFSQDRHYMPEDIEEQGMGNCIELYKKLGAAFYDKTGMNLDLVDVWDENQELTESCFGLLFTDVYQLTDKAKELGEKYFEMREWIEWG